MGDNFLIDEMKEVASSGAAKHRELLTLHEKLVYIIKEVENIDYKRRSVGITVINKHGGNNNTITLFGDAANAVIDIYREQKRKEIDSILARIEALEKK